MTRDFLAGLPLLEALTLLTLLVLLALTFFKTARPVVFLILLIAAASLLARILLESSLGTTSLLYVGVPFVVTLLLAISSRSNNPRWQSKYWNGFRTTFLVLFACSIVLYEGFICVLMFLPIYLMVSAIAWIVEATWRGAEKRDRKIRVHILPILVVLASLEGTHDNLSFDRYNEVTATRVAQASIEDLRANLALPIDLDQTRSGVLGLFPMPYRVDAESMAPGTVHALHFRYYKWFVTNVHEGRMLLQIVENGPSHLVTRILDDTSYLSGYVRLHGTRIEFEALDSATTKVTLKVRFDRKLDPAWYFGPLEKMAINKTAEFLIDEVVIRDAES